MKTKTRGNPRLTKPGFRKWLSAKSPRQVVGKARCLHSCPIANFTGAIEVCVDEITMENGKAFTPPYWVSEFIEMVDDTVNRRVTAVRAIRILDAIR